MFEIKILKIYVKILVKFWLKGSGGGGGLPPTKPPHVTKAPPDDDVVIIESDDSDSDTDEAEEPYNPFMQDPCIGELGPIANPILSTMYPEGIPGYYDAALPFHPTHQYVNRTQATQEGLNQITIDLEGTRQRIVELTVQRNGLLSQSIKQTKSMDNMIHKTIKGGVTKNKIKLTPSKVACASNNQALQAILRGVELDYERHLQLQRNQRQVARAIRLGMNYRAANPGHNFVIFINEDFPIIQRTQLHQRPAFPPPSERPPTRKRRGNTETNFLWGHDETRVFHINHDLTNQDFPVRSVTNLKEFLEVHLDGRSKIIVYPFEHETPQFNALKAEFSSLFWIMSHTINGYFSSDFYQKEIIEMNEAFVFFNEKINEASDDKIHQKKQALNRFKHFIMETMNVDLKWYWDPNRVIKEMINKLKGEHLILE